MKLNDAVWGALLLALSAAVFLEHPQLSEHSRAEHRPGAPSRGCIATALAGCAVDPAGARRARAARRRPAAGVRRVAALAPARGQLPAHLRRDRVLPAGGAAARLPRHRDAPPAGALPAAPGEALAGGAGGAGRGVRRSTSRSTSCCASRCPGACCPSSTDETGERPWTSSCRPCAWSSTPTSSTVIFFSSLYGLFVGAVPGLTATMATALLVPVTFFMPPVPAVAAIVTATAMAIFSGDIPGCLLRIPGTPASAAYTDEAYAMTLKGQAETALGAGLWFSAVGGLFGTLVMIFMAPSLAEVAIKFSSFEYFWLVVLGPGERRLHRLLVGGEGADLAAARPARRLHRPGEPGRASALHLRRDRPALGRGADPDDGRHVRGVGDPALHGRHESAGPHPQGEARQRVHRHVDADARNTAGACCAAARSAPRSASSPAPAPTWRPGCRMR